MAQDSHEPSDYITETVFHERLNLRLLEREHFHTTTKQIKINSVALVRKRTIPTERPPLVGEVSANFSSHDNRPLYRVKLSLCLIN
jgi:hypothetical protein